MQCLNVVKCITSQHRRIRFLTFFLSCMIVLQALVSYSQAETVVYHSVKTDSKKIAITFDDGPHPFLTEKIMSILDEYNAKATFFMVGINVINYPDVARKVIAAGHEVGNHTFSHNHLKVMSEAALSNELGRCEDALEELCEYRPHLFRPPEGAVNTYIQHCSDNGDYRLVLWSVDTRDWENKDTNRIVDAVLSQIKPGDIILMHDYIGYHSKTPEALQVLLPKLIEDGYEPVTVSQLLGFA